MAEGGFETCGWFGKIPCLGDFASRRLPQNFITRCDEWLSQGLHTSRQQLGDQWLHVFLGAPVWRFAWSPGIVDQAWWLGVMMPSVDSAGRYYPLIVARAAPDLPEASPALQAWFEHVAQAALCTLQNGASVERLETQLAQAPAWPGTIAPHGINVQSLAGRQRYAYGAGTPLHHCLELMGRHHLQQRLQGQSLWWQPDAGDGSGSLSVAPGLPAPAQFAELLQGSW